MLVPPILVHPVRNQPSSRARCREKIGQFWGLVYDGIDKDGKYMFKDLDGDGKVDKDAMQDKTYVGNGLPKFEWGLATPSSGRIGISIFSSAVHSWSSVY